MSFQDCEAPDCPANQRTPQINGRTPTGPSRSGNVSINRIPEYMDAPPNAQALMANFRFAPSAATPARPPLARTPGEISFAEGIRHHFTADQPIMNPYDMVDMEWIAKDINISQLIEQNKNLQSRFRRMHPQQRSTPVVAAPERNDPRFLLNQPPEELKESPSSVKQESIMQWFDRTVENELQKRRDSPTSGSPTLVDPALRAAKGHHAANLTKNTLDRVSEASASRIEIAGIMRMQPDSDLTDAVEKLAKAEAMCAFADAVEAAETAAEAAPPGLAEEAAVAGVRQFQTKVTTTSNIRETIAGERPIEVVGYVGVTRPKHPKQS